MIMTTNEKGIGYGLTTGFGVGDIYMELAVH